MSHQVPHIESLGAECNKHIVQECSEKRHKDGLKQHVNLNSEKIMNRSEAKLPFCILCVSGYGQ